MKLSFSLGSKAKPPVGEAPSLRKAPAFGSLDDEETTDAAPVASGSKRPPPTVATGSWRPNRKKETLDASVLQYDEVYDDMKDAEQRAKAALESKDKDKKSKYMSSLLQSAETRKLDFVRAEEKLMQREREKEGDEFADKEKFVTPAYKAQMEEVRRAEEEEKKREEAERKKRKNAPGLAAFYREFLQKSSDQHDAAIAATQAASQPEPSNQDFTVRRPLKIAPDPDSVFKPQSDLEKAEVARAEGKEVELNDDGQLVDKREVLSAGLNLSAPNTRKLGFASKSSASKEEAPVIHRAAGTAATRQEIRARQERELQKQVEEERKRLAEEEERKEAEERERYVKRKNTEGEIQSARERYLERKRRKMEEEATAGSTG